MLVSAWWCTWLPSKTLKNTSGCPSGGRLTGNLNSNSVFHPVLSTYLFGLKNVPKSMKTR